MTSFSTEWTTITPAMAATLLQSNRSNRPLSSNAVKDIADRMSEGSWTVTHQGIGVDVNGDLVDGQHRLAAIVKSGIAFRYLVTTGLPPETFDHVDVGGKGVRTTADLVARRMPGLMNRIAISAAAVAALKGRNGPLPDKVEVVNFVEAHHEGISPFVTALRGQGRIFGAPVMAAFINAARQPSESGGFVGPKGGRDFDLVLASAQRLGTMTWGEEGDPLKMLFLRLLREKEAHGSRADPQFVYGLTVGAIRADLDGRTLNKVMSSTVDWGDPEDRARGNGERHSLRQVRS